MFTPIAMQKVTLQVLSDEAPLAAMVLARCGVFDPDSTEVFHEQFPEQIGSDYRELFTSAQTRLDKILAHYDINVTTTYSDSQEPIAEENLAGLNKWLRQLWEECSQEEELRRRDEEELKHADQLLQALQEFASLDIDLGVLHGKRQFLDIRIGVVNESNAQRLSEALSLAGYVMTPFLTSEDTIQAVVAGMIGHEHDIDEVLHAAGWHSTQVPPEFQGHPNEVRQELTQKRQLLLEALKHSKQSRIVAPEIEAKLKQAAQTLTLAAPYATLSSLLCRRGSLTVMTGWVPKRELSVLQSALADRLDQRFVLNSREPLGEERPRVPSFTTHHKWIQPFAELVKNYGVPRYGEIDPTLLFAFSFVAMFGMMFGDIGHGAVIAAGGYRFRHKLGKFTSFVVAAGASSTFFGFLYGSIFGFEHTVPALWMSPLSDPILMLKLAFAWGVAFILIATGLTIRNRLYEKSFKEALFHGNGLAGMLMYLGLLVGGYQWFVYASVGPIVVLAMLLPLAVVLGYIAYEYKDKSIGERILIVVVEGFEAVMSYISNTLSFLRVAAFSLNHVALAIAIFTLGGMMDTPGYWITVVLGNIFILVLEGAIVAIQVLRLEYYEGFSRFFSGDGREFRPLTLASNTEPNPSTETV